ncbi:hypothetical protein BDV93DRAFT_604753 [Ceratobasidium sp. AG-I]|nr:hypothetical protein BDV93DRAFT_604753 [Ceratobasidium sp. AG-I]
MGHVKGSNSSTHPPVPLNESNVAMQPSYDCARLPARSTDLNQLERLLKRSLGGKSARTSGNQVYILVMGPTGAGKSTFINTICNSTLAVSDGLKSCTHQVDVSTYQTDDNTVIHLIDTPGFNDSTRSAVEILQEISSGLQMMHEFDMPIHGIIYMHRISDQRISGSACRDFSTFMDVCGKPAMKCTSIVTSMWDLVDPDVGNAREAELRDSSLFFGNAIQEGAKIHRNYNTAESARTLISTMVREEPVTLLILQELIDEEKTLLETTAGKELDRELAQQRAKHEEDLAQLRVEHAQALAQRDAETKEELEAEMDRIRDTAAAASAKRAPIYIGLGDLDNAETLQLKVLEARNRILGPEHPSTLTSMHNLAAIYKIQGRPKECAEYESQYMEATKRARGETDMKVLASAAELIEIYLKLGALPEAQALQLQQVRAFGTLVSMAHPATLKCMRELATTYELQGLQKEVEELNLTIRILEIASGSDSDSE